MISIKHNINEVVKEFKNIQQSVVKAERSANKKVARQVVTEIVKGARERYSIKASDLKDAIDIKNGTGKNVSAKIVISNSRIPLAKFSAKPSATGVGVMVLRGRRKVIKGSFIPVLKSGHLNVFVRPRVGSKRVPRLPIKQLYGLSAAKMLINERSMQIATNKVFQKFNELYTHELEYYLNKKS